jgi:DNA-binding MarR family transcriptional regulator
METNELALLLLAEQIDSIARQHRAAASRVLQEWNLTETASGLLWALGSADTPLAMRDAAETLGCDPSNVTVLAEQLESQGLVERVPDLADRRRRILCLTSRGKNAWDKVCSEVAATSPLRHFPLEDLGRALGRR